MGSRIFLDANVILDQVLKRTHYESTRLLFQHVVSGQFSAFTSPSIIHIIGYWLSKAYGAAKARQIIITLLNDVYVLELNHDITIQAMHSEIADIEDALHYHSAIYHKMDFFVSSDKKLKAAASAALPVIAPQELLTRFH